MNVSNQKAWAECSEMRRDEFFKKYELTEDEVCDKAIKEFNEINPNFKFDMDNKDKVIKQYNYVEIAIALNIYLRVLRYEYVTSFDVDDCVIWLCRYLDRKHMSIYDCVKGENNV